MATLLLFDIDGTLVRGSRAARNAFAAAVHACYGIVPDTSTLDSAGKTDFQIMREILDGHGLRDVMVEERLLDIYLQHLSLAIQRDPGEECPGARLLLQHLVKENGLTPVLGTGNLERSAWIKLAAHHLDMYFETGGFGEDGVGRDAVIAAGIARARVRYRTEFDRIVVVGDTPYDIAGGRANGAFTLGVATGPYDLQSLRQAGATIAIPDFTETERVIAALTSLPSPHHSS